MLSDTGQPGIRHRVVYSGDVFHAACRVGYGNPGKAVRDWDRVSLHKTCSIPRAEKGVIQMVQPKHNGSGAPRIGFYICHCGTNIAGTIDVKAVAEYAATLPNVAVSRDY